MPLTWDTIDTTLQRLGNNRLAKSIHSSVWFLYGDPQEDWQSLLMGHSLFKKLIYYLDTSYQLFAMLHQTRRILPVLQYSNTEYQCTSLPTSDNQVHFEESPCWALTERLGDVGLGQSLLFYLKSILYLLCNKCKPFVFYSI